MAEQKPLVIIEMKSILEEAQELLDSDKATPEQKKVLGFLIDMADKNPVPMQLINETDVVNAKIKDFIIREKCLR